MRAPLDLKLIKDRLYALSGPAVSSRLQREQEEARKHVLSDMRALIKEVGRLRKSERDYKRRLGDAVALSAHSDF